MLTGRSSLLIGLVACLAIGTVDCLEITANRNSFVPSTKQTRAVNCGGAPPAGDKTNIKYMLADVVIFDTDKPDDRGKCSDCPSHSS